MEINLYVNGIFGKPGSIKIEIIMDNILYWNFHFRIAYVADVKTYIRQTIYDVFLCQHVDFIRNKIPVYDTLEYNEWLFSRFHSIWHE